MREEPRPYPDIRVIPEEYVVYHGGGSAYFPRENLMYLDDITTQSLSEDEVQRTLNSLVHEETHWVQFMYLDDDELTAFENAYTEMTRVVYRESRGNDCSLLHVAEKCANIVAYTVSGEES